jgi:hypothetical protein
MLTINPSVNTGAGAAVQSRGLIIAIISVLLAHPAEEPGSIDKQSHYPRLRRGPRAGAD